jgi:hypothetical protein
MGSDARFWILRNYKLSGKPALRGIGFMLRKAVIPAAGLGTRLLSVTKEQPKEMLTMLAKVKNHDPCLKPC